MKRILITLALAFATLFSPALQAKIPQQMLEIVEVEINEGSTVISVFNMPGEDGNHYYLCVGSLGIGDETIQMDIDPYSQLFIYLGPTLAESLEQLTAMQALFKQAPGSALEAQGSLAVGYPRENLEPVAVTHRKVLLGRSLEFSISSQRYLRATYIAKSDFASIVSGVKFYKKLHKKEL